MNLISSNFRTMYLMSKNVFKDMGTIDAIRFEMEVCKMTSNLQNKCEIDEILFQISLMESNKTDLDLVVSRQGDDPANYFHIEVLYQWKDKFYMEVDSLAATRIIILTLFKMGFSKTAHSAYFTK